MSGLWQGSVRLRQKPGGRNALGGAKFRFPNRDSIYLHGTPAKGLFRRGNRALSHGCIRLPDETRFAAYLLRSQGWSDKQVRSVIRSQKNREVKLAKPVAIYLTYDTTIVKPNGSLYFAPDVYGRDSALLKALKLAAQTSPTI